MDGVDPVVNGGGFGTGPRRGARAAKSLTEQAGPGHAGETDEEDSDLLRGGHAGAARKDVVAGTLDAAEEGVVDGDENPESRPAFTVNERQQGLGGALVVFGAGGDGGQ